ncbi:MAG: hypothetical protein J0L53_13460 [Spirochaetes bacterium]|nr:hypothetical protein [Spirochaetota bacterium]
MSFVLRHRILLLFGLASVLLVAALFWPEAKKSGEMQKYYSVPPSQLQAIEYSGEMTLVDKTKARIEYTITREDNVLKPKEPLYRVDIRSLTTADTKIVRRVEELRNLKRFYAGSLMKTIVQDWAEPDFFYVLKHEPERDAEYGIKDCPNRLTATFRSGKRQFCVGNSSQGDTRRYLLDVDKDKLLITPDFTVRRVQNNIFAQREQSLYPHGNEGADLIEIKIGAEPLKKFPLLKEKTGGLLKLRMLVKEEEKNKINVWHVDGMLSVKPSHAAELAQLLNALRVSAPFATDAAGAEKPASEVMRAAGIDAKSVPGISGAIKVKKTDQQDLNLSEFAFFAPGVKPTPQPAFQFENQLVRPLDTIVVSQYNAGFISADLYPRLNGILTKFENDFLEAQKKGDLEKKEREKKEKEKQSPQLPALSKP